MASASVLSLQRGGWVIYKLEHFALCGFALRKLYRL